MTKKLCTIQKLLTFNEIYARFHDTPVQAASYARADAKPGDFVVLVMPGSVLPDSLSKLCGLSVVVDKPVCFSIEDTALNCTGLECVALASIDLSVVVGVKPAVLLSLAEAADRANVSKSFLNKMLAVGLCKSLYCHHVDQYIAEVRVARRQALAELTELMEEMGDVFE